MKLLFPNKVVFTTLVQRLKELLYWSSLGNFQFFAINNRGNIRNQKLRNCWGQRAHTFFESVFKTYSVYRAQINDKDMVMEQKCKKTDSPINDITLARCCKVLEVQLTFSLRMVRFALLPRGCITLR